ncbi:MAG: type II toxin-antitoxin system prevent-host-death family antitoxin [Actinobacteria bacterium]|nr:type II toxin-antitoxin system prevent-host-death family antitoxin [Actinomycetota bacterium]
MTVSIGIRELRQNASRYLRLVEERGEPIQITDRGRPVALLAPLPDSGTIERLVATGRLRRGKGGPLPKPVDPIPGVPLPSEILAEMRANER